MDLLTSYLITVPMRSKSADEVTMTYLKRVLPISSCSMYILQDNGTEFRNKQLVDTFKSLGVKPIYSSPYYPCGNGKLENSNNFLKWSIAKFLHNTNLEWDDIIPIATYEYNISLTANGLESPFYLVFGRDPMEGRLTHIQGYCRYVREQPGRQMVQELQKLWKIHAETLHDIRTKNNPEEGDDDTKYDKATDLKIGQLVLIKNNTGTAFDPKDLADHRIVWIVNESIVILQTPDGKEKRCNIYNVKPINTSQAFTLAFRDVQESAT